MSLKKDYWLLVGVRQAEAEGWVFEYNTETVSVYYPPHIQKLFGIAPYTRLYVCDNYQEAVAAIEGFYRAAEVIGKMKTSLRKEDYA